MHDQLEQCQGMQAAAPTLSNYGSLCTVSLICPENSAVWLPIPHGESDGYALQGENIFHDEREDSKCAFTVTCITYFKVKTHSNSKTLTIEYLAKGSSDTLFFKIIKILQNSRLIIL